MSEPLKWTKEPPTVPGYYWWRDGHVGPAGVLRLAEEGRALLSFSTKSDFVCPPRMRGGEWCGPIEPPQ
jgi:hypothetical protein